VLRVAGGIGFVDSDAPERRRNVFLPDANPVIFDTKPISTFAVRHALKLDDPFIVGIDETARRDGIHRIPKQFSDDGFWTVIIKVLREEGDDVRGIEVEGLGLR
jgi:hypothetical protein